MHAGPTSHDVFAACGMSRREVDGRLLTVGKVCISLTWKIRRGSYETLCIYSGDYGELSLSLNHIFILGESDRFLKGLCISKTQTCTLVTHIVVCKCFSCETFASFCPLVLSVVFVTLCLCQLLSLSCAVSPPFCVNGPQTFSRHVD